MTAILIAILLLPSAPLSAVREWLVSRVRWSLAQILKRRVINRLSKTFLTSWQLGKVTSAHACWISDSNSFRTFFLWCRREKLVARNIFSASCNSSKTSEVHDTRQPSLYDFNCWSRQWLPAELLSDWIARAQVSQVLLFFTTRETRYPVK